jgi:transcriptional regulator of acetoin/glycerol metabolism
MGRLKDYPFPGNVRELEHIIERAVILSDSKTLTLPEIKKDVLNGTLITERQSLQEYERLYIIDTLEQCKWRVSGPHGAAKILDVKPTTLFAKMKRLGITRK